MTMTIPFLHYFKKAKPVEGAARRRSGRAAAGREAEQRTVEQDRDAERDARVAGAG